MSTTGMVLLSSQMALQRSVDVVANNIANSNTTGFKREGVQFDTYITKPTTKQATNFVYDRATYRDTSPGAITTTGNPLDLAIQGKGYFEVQTPTGIQYTRDGAFHIDNQGQIVTSSNMPVLDSGGQPIIVPDDARDITFSSDGFITLQTGTETSRAQLGTLGVVQFDNDEALAPTSSGLLTTTQTAAPAAEGTLVQGAIENSNVRPVLEITDLIKMQRAYEQATSLVGQENTRLTNAIQALSQPSS